MTVPRAFIPTFNLENNGPENDHEDDQENDHETDHEKDHENDITIASDDGNLFNTSK